MAETLLIRLATENRGFHDWVLVDEQGVARSPVQTGVPVTFGVITADNLEQAVERAGTKMGNKGWEAALAAIEMARLFQES